MKKSCTLFFPCVLLLLAFLLSTESFAGNGKITGRITDKSTNEALPSANIIISHQIVSGGREIKMDQVLGAASDADGYYFILNVPPGIYVLKTSMIGYKAAITKGIVVESDRTITVDIPLSSSSYEVNEVVVTARNEIVKKDVSGTQEIISTARVASMPVMRVDEFVGKLKGVQLVSGADGNGLSVRGGAIRETDIRLDGVSLQDPRSDNSYLSLNSTTIDQLQVITGGFEAKYGGIRSGLMNVTTKEGHRERYTISLKGDVTPGAQKRTFGTDPYGKDSPIYQVFAGKYAMNGIQTHEDSMAVPREFWGFKGWKKMGDRSLDSLQNLEIWKMQHPTYDYGNKPDYYFEGCITGPIPGEDIPLWGAFAERTTFMLGFKYENTQFAFPLGPRDHYLDWNAQLKLTSKLSDDSKLALNGMFAKIETNNSGSNTTYGGALIDQTTSFGFLSGSESSVNRQGALLGGTSGFFQMYNKSRFQFFDQRYILGGAKFTKTLSSKSYYTISAQVGYTDQTLKPFALDTTTADAWTTFYSAKAKKNVRVLNIPWLGSPNGSTNPINDALGYFQLVGGLQRADSSYTYVGEVKGEYVSQIGRHHQFETGFSVRLEDMFVYSGSWLQGKISFTPDLWQYYKAHPLTVGAYVQDKLEFEGMILNAGLRFDFFNPFKEGFAAGIPVDANYPYLYNQIYQNLTGEWGGYERWLKFRELLEDPTNWPRTGNTTQFYVSPRLGVSFPITESSKMYFNYGVFYQRPATSFLYNQIIDLYSVTLPTPELKMPRTTSYEFGFEQMFLDHFVFNITAYYKDLQNEPLSRKFVSYDGDNILNKYYPDAYKDIRGVELRFEIQKSDYMSLYAMYDYMVASSGQAGLSTIYENKIDAHDEMRSASAYTSDAIPRANVNLNLFTPSDFGPEFAGIKLLGSWNASFMFEWKDGGRILWNPEETDRSKYIYVDQVNYWNIDFRGGKTFELPFGTLELVVTIKNLTNNKWLNTSNMTTNQLSDYKASLRLPHQGGSDKWGQYESDDGHIKTGWWDAPIFLNPRRVVVGLRLNI
jgi:hypothetical protein